MKIYLLIYIISCPSQIYIWNEISLCNLYILTYILFRWRQLFNAVFHWDFLSTSPTQQTKWTECCVLGTPTTPEPRYLILSTSPVLTTGDTSSTTTTGLILRILRGILVSPTLTFVKWKCTVRNPICPDRTLIMLVMKCVNLQQIYNCEWYSIFLKENFIIKSVKYQCTFTHFEFSVMLMKILAFLKNDFSFCNWSCIILFTFALLHRLISVIFCRSVIFATKFKDFYNLTF